MKFNRKIAEIYLKLKYGLRLNKPRLLLKLAKNYSTVILFKKIPLKYVEFAIDYRCNLKCEHCFAESFKKPSSAKKMGIKDYQRVVKEAMALGAFDFSIQGGEPTLFFDWTEQVIKACEPSKNLVAVTTNASFLNKEKIIRMKKLGVDHFTFSIDSGIAREHDVFRGVKGTFNKAMEAMKLARGLGMNVLINTTLSHQNIRSEGIQKLIEFACRNKILLNTILAAPAGRWQERIEVMLTKEDLEYLEGLRKKYPFIRRDVDANYFEYGCGAVKESIYITAYGDVLSCPFIHISLGNILREPLKKIIERGLSLDFFRKYRKKCLVAEDEEFIEKYLSRTYNKENLPISFEEGFGEK